MAPVSGASSSHTLSWRLIRGTPGPLSTQIYVQLNALWATHKGKLRDKEETALALKQHLDTNTSSPWHVVVGPEDFVTNIRYRSRPSPERCFLLANPHHKLRALIFQSSPCPPPPPPSLNVSLPASLPEPLPLTSVYSTDLPTDLPTDDDSISPPSFRPSLPLLLSLATLALHTGKGEPVASSIALKDYLTCHPSCGGPLWHVIIARDNVEMGLAIEARPSMSFLDARVQGGAKVLRVVTWKHDLSLSMWEEAGLALPFPSFSQEKTAQWVFVVLMLLALVLALLTQAKAWTGLDVLKCPTCEREGCMMNAEEEEEARACGLLKGRIRNAALACLTAALVSKAWARRTRGIERLERTSGGGRGRGGGRGASSSSSTLSSGGGGRGSGGRRRPVAKSRNK
ncbi:hypothetical protein VYU27_008031 [Nannochloropsis oceanica]